MTCFLLLYSHHQLTSILPRQKSVLAFCLQRPTALAFCRQRPSATTSPSSTMMHISNHNPFKKTHPPSIHLTHLRYLDRPVAAHHSYFARHTPTPPVKLTADEVNMPGSDMISRRAASMIHHHNDITLSGVVFEHCRFHTSRTRRRARAPRGVQCDGGHLRGALLAERQGHGPLPAELFHGERGDRGAAQQGDAQVVPRIADGDYRCEYFTESAATARARSNWYTYALHRTLHPFI